MHWNANSLQEHPLIFEERFWRCRDSLLRVARFALGNTKAASQVVEDCFLTASRNPPKFASEVASVAGFFEY
jgi:DNA-directed RNA polymerase specialized sigma24 family protein